MKNTKVKLKKEYEEFLCLLKNTKLKTITTTSKWKNKYMIFIFFIKKKFIYKKRKYLSIRDKKMNPLFYN